MTNKELEKANNQMLGMIKSLECRIKDFEHKEGKTITVSANSSTHDLGCKPKEEPQINNWYMVCDKFIINFQEYGNGNNYGFNARCEWSVDLGWHEGDSFRELTPQEIETALIKEAKKEFKIGCKIKYLDGEEGKLLGHDFIYVDGAIYVSGSNKSPYCELFKDGKWATIIQNSFEIAGHKVEIDKKANHVKIGCQSFFIPSLLNLYESCMACGINYIYHKEAVGIPLYIDDLKELIDYIDARNI